MPAHIVVKGKKYPLPEKFTLGELREIKRISGLRPGEIGDALEVGDPDLLAAFAKIAIERTGGFAPIERLDELDMEDELTVEAIEEDDSDPPESGGSETTPESSGSQSTDTSSD